MVLFKGFSRLGAVAHRAFLADAVLKNTFEFDDGDIVLVPLGAGLDLPKCGLQDLNKMAGFRTAHGRLIDPVLHGCNPSAGAVGDGCHATALS